MKKELPKRYEKPMTARVGRFSTDTRGRFSWGRSDSVTEGYRKAWS